MSKDKEKKLTPKQQRFVEEYCTDFNATQAAIRTGYSENSAGQQGERLLKNDEIWTAIQNRLKKQSERIQVDQDWVLKHLVQNVQRAMQTIPVTDKEGNPTGEYKYEGSVANKALELIGKHYGMFVEKHEHTGRDGKPIEVNHEHNHKLETYFDDLESDTTPKESD